LILKDFSSNLRYNISIYPVFCEVAMVPQSLRFWFVIHFVVDFIFAVPLLIAPVWLLTLFGFEAPDPFTARLVGAALLGIGGESLLGWNATIEAFRAMLNLKIIWSLSAIAGIILTLIFTGGPLIAYLILLIFAAFSGLWLYYRFLLR
jgi:hypothetical protein